MTPTTQKAITIGLVLLLIGLVAILISFLLPKSKDTNAQNTINPSKYSDFSVKVPVEKILPANDINIAKRRGICRTMNQHLVNYATTKDEKKAKTAYKGMTILANEMMNYYQINTSKDTTLNSQTLADPKIWLDKEGFHNQRQKLTTLLEHNATNTDYANVASQIKAGCQGCHQTYLKPVS